MPITSSNKYTVLFHLYKMSRIGPSIGIVCRSVVDAGGNEEKLLIDTESLLEGRKCSKLHYTLNYIKSVNTLKIKIYTLNGWTVWYVSHISIKVLKEGKRTWDEL